MRAEDERPVEPVRERKSVGKEITLERDIADRGQMEAILAKLAEQVERPHTQPESTLERFSAHYAQRQPHTGVPVCAGDAPGASYPAFPVGQPEAGGAPARGVRVQPAGSTW